MFQNNPGLYEHFPVASIEEFFRRKHEYSFTTEDDCIVLRPSGSHMRIRETVESNKVLIRTLENPSLEVVKSYILLAEQGLEKLDPIAILDASETIRSFLSTKSDSFSVSEDGGVIKVFGLL